MSLVLTPLVHLASISMIVACLLALMLTPIVKFRNSENMHENNICMFKISGSVITLLTFVLLW